MNINTSENKIEDKSNYSKSISPKSSISSDDIDLEKQDQHSIHKYYIDERDIVNEKHNNEHIETKTTHSSSSTSSSNDSSQEHQHPQIYQEPVQTLQRSNTLQSILSTTSISSLAKKAKRVIIQWAQVFGAFMLMINSWGWYGVFKNFYNSELLSDRSLFNIAWIGSLHIFLVNIIGIFVSNRMVRAGYVKYSVGIAIIIVTFGMIMVSLSKEYYQIILAQGIVMGVGCAFSTSAAIPTVNAYFAYTPTKYTNQNKQHDEAREKLSFIAKFKLKYHMYRKSLAVGLASTGGALGGIIYPTMGLELIPKLTFQQAAQVIAALIFGTSIASVFLLLPVPDAPPRSHWNWVSHWKSEGRNPSFLSSISSFLAVSQLLDDWTAFHDINFILFAAGLLLFQAGLYVPAFFISQFGVAYGASVDYALYLLPVLNSGAVVGRFLPGFMAQIMGPLNAISVSIVGCVTIAWAWLSVKSSPNIAIFAVAYGFLSGTFMALPNMCFGAMAPSAEVAGKRTNLGSIIGSLGILIGPPLGGLLIIEGDTIFTDCQYYTAVLMTTGGILMIASRMTFTKGKFRIKA